MLADGIECFGTGLVGRELVAPLPLTRGRGLDVDQAVEPSGIFMPRLGDQESNVERILGAVASLAADVERFVVMGRFFHGAEPRRVAVSGFP